jgi:hypothetical protein
MPRHTRQENSIDTPTNCYATTYEKSAVRDGGTRLAFEEGGRTIPGEDLSCRGRKDLPGEEDGFAAGRGG